jgi:hypothetical protein
MVGRNIRHLTMWGGHSCLPLLKLILFLSFWLLGVV